MRQRALSWGAALGVAMLSALAVDNVLFWASPWLPPEIVAKLSPFAYARYLSANAQGKDFDYRGEIRTMKPLRQARANDPRLGASDEFGYRNPPGYTNSLSSIDILVAGDSFAWGTQERTIADYLRQMLAPLTVYSVGQAASTLTQSADHAENIATVSGKLDRPRIIVLNFSGGHAVNELLYEHRLREYGLTGAIAFYAWRSVSLTDDREFRNLRWRGLMLREIRAVFHNAFAAMPAHADAGLRPACDGDTCPEVEVRAELDVEPAWQLIERALESTASRLNTRFPGVRIVLGYIPANAAVWGEKLCQTCNKDWSINRRNIEYLRALCGRLGIVLADASEALRDLADAGVPVSEDVHLSARGYEVYSRVLADAIIGR